MSEVNIDIGQMFAFAKMGEWDKVDDMLMQIDDELWLATKQLSSLDEFKQFALDDLGIDLYDDI